MCPRHSAGPKAPGSVIAPTQSWLPPSGFWLIPWTLTVMELVDSFSQRLEIGVT